MTNKEANPSNDEEAHPAIISPTPIPIVTAKIESEFDYSRILLLAAASAFVAAIITEVVMGMLHVGDDVHDYGMLVVGYVGTTVGSFLAGQQSQEPRLPLAMKASLGGVLAAVCLVFALLCQRFAHWFTEPEIAISLGVILTFVSPFILSNKPWRGGQTIGKRK